MRLDAVIARAWALLSADATLATLIGSDKVFTSVDEDTVTPFIRLVASEEPWALATNDDETGPALVTLAVELWSMYEGTAELEDALKRAQALLAPVSAWSGVSGFGGVLRGPIEAPIVEFLIGQEMRRARALVRVFFA